MTTSGTPMLTYSPDGVAHTEEPVTAVPPLVRALGGLTWAALAVCLAIWAVVGIVLWVPLVAREVIRFSGSLVPSMLTGTRPERAALRLRDAVNLYWRGFVVAIETVTGTPPDPRWAPPQWRARRMDTWQIMNEIAWVAVIWYGVLLLLGTVQTTPLDMWYWLRGTAWVERPMGTIIDWAARTL